MPPSVTALYALADGVWKAATGLARAEVALAQRAVTDPDDQALLADALLDAEDALAASITRLLEERGSAWTHPAAPL